MLKESAPLLIIFIIIMMVLAFVGCSAPEAAQLTSDAVAQIEVGTMPDCIP